MEYYKKLFSFTIGNYFTMAEHSIIFDNQPSYLLIENKNALGMTFCIPTFELNREIICEQIGEICKIIFLFTVIVIFTPRLSRRHLKQLESLIK